MAHPTEAACLLETGALYGKRLLLRPAAGDPVFAGFKQGAFSLYFGDAPIFHFDLEGRWQRAFCDGLHYLKGLDTTVQTIDRVRERDNLVMKRRTVPLAEADDFDARVRATALGLIADLDSGRLDRVEPPPRALPLLEDELRTFLERIARWDAAAWVEHRAAYLGTYGPLPLLPPDSLNDLILQATVGHAGDMDFGGGPPVGHSVRTPEAFEAHVQTVAALLGRRVAQCRNVFLGGADVLRRPADDVAAYLGAVGRTFPLEPGSGLRRPDPSADPNAPPRFDGVHAFLDEFAPPGPGLGEFARWRSLGLARVSLGVESGDPAVRALYGKTWANGDLTATVRALKGAGLGVGVIALVGAGGVEHAARHAEATAALLNALDLGPGDLVSLVDAAELLGPDPAARPEPLSFTPLAGAAFTAQLDDLKARLAPLRQERRAKVAPYSPGKQGIV
jgi:hypothetical protein